MLGAKICLLLVLNVDALRFNQQAQEEVSLSKLPDGVMVPPTDKQLTALKEAYGKVVTKYGGKASLMIVGDSTQYHLNLLATTYLSDIPGLTWEFVENRKCPAEMMKSMAPNLSKASPNGILFNFGLHLLHLFPTRTCGPKEKGFSKEQTSQHEELTEFDKLFTPKPPVNCGPYKNVIETSAQFFQSNAKNSRVVFRSTNKICTDKFEAGFKDDVANWRDPVKGQELEKKCQAVCKAFAYNNDRKCGDEIFDEHSTQKQHDTALEVLQGFPDIKILDAFKITDGQCALTDQGDGRHYRPLDHVMLEEYARLLLED